MRFTKMHGIGNDYVYVNGFTERVDDPSAVARVISDRHFGIGSDGLILILPSEVADVRMRMFNADGSEGEMCGNGVRCVAKYAFEHDLTKNNPMRVETGRGVLNIAMQVNAGKVVAATVDMGEPIFETALIPCTLPVPRVVDFPMPESSDEAEVGWWRDCQLDPKFTCVNTGNPHIVLFCNDVDRVPLADVGLRFENAEIFPQRANVHFVQIIKPNELKMRTWERGSGITLACGTGASAVCVAGALTNRSDRKVIIHLPGGDLNIEWRESDNRVYMTGPATEVFSGKWNAS